MSAAASLPDYDADAYFLYALEFSNGSIKIGRSFKPKSRARQIENQYGLRLVRGVAHAHDRGTLALAEAEALTRATKIATPIKGHLEFFSGLKFGDAATLVRQMAGRKHARRAQPSQTPAGRKVAAAARAVRAEAAALARFSAVVAALHTEGAPAVETARV